MFPCKSVCLFVCLLIKLRHLSFNGLYFSIPKEQSLALLISTSSCISWTSYTSLVDLDSKSLSRSHEQWNTHQDIAVVTSTYIHYSLRGRIKDFDVRASVLVPYGHSLCSLYGAEKPPLLSSHIPLLNWTGACFWGQSHLISTVSGWLVAVSVSSGRYNRIP